jgi:tetratricopeptide (TPR) repeat protein
MRSTLLVLCLVTGMAGSLPGQAPQARPLSIQELEAAVRTDSNDALLHYQLGMAYFDHKKWDQAQGALQTAITIAPAYADAYLALSVLPARRGEGYWKARIKTVGEDSVRTELIRAESQFRRAFLLNPLVELKVLGKFEGTESAVMFGTNRGTFVVRFTPWWDHELTKAINEFRDGRYEKAAERMAELRKDRRFGGDDQNMPGPLLWYHGLTAAHLEQFEVAIRDFSVLTGRAYAVEQRHDSSGTGSAALPLQTNDYRFLLATMLYLGGRYRDAVPTFRRVLEFDLGLYMAHVQMARMFEAQGRLDDALKERQLALDANPEDPDLLIDLAGALVQAGSPAEAEAPLLQAARLNPRDARAPYQQGIVEELLQQPDAEREAFQRFLSIAPSRLEAMKQDARDRLSHLP